MAGLVKRRTDGALLGILTEHTLVALHKAINVATGSPGANGTLRAG